MDAHEWVPFSKLTPAEAERLALLLEELGEAQQAIGKILRHGYESCHPDSLDGPTNRESLERELGDVHAALRMMYENEDISSVKIGHRAETKARAVQKYLHHQGPRP